jgi:hypothetical protein
MAHMQSYLNLIPHHALLTSPSLSSITFLFLSHGKLGIWPYRNQVIWNLLLHSSDGSGHQKKLPTAMAEYLPVRAISPAATMLFFNCSIMHALMTGTIIMETVVSDHI